MSLSRNSSIRHAAALLRAVIVQRCLSAVLLGILISACGQASPQGLDDLGGRPGFEGLTIYPQYPSIQPEETVQFELRGSNGVAVDENVKWSATGGTITRSGKYTAGNEPGTYEVRAKLGNWVTVQQLSIDSGGSEPDSGGSEPDSGGSEPDSGDSQRDAPSGTTLLQDDFERGDFVIWSKAARVGDPNWDGSGDGGAHIGDGYIANEQVHSGKLSWKALIDPTEDSFGRADKSSLENWRSTRNVSEFYISAWYFIPANYPAASTLIMQIKSGGDGLSHKPVGIRVNRDRELVIRSAILDKTLFQTGIDVPVGRWFNLTGRFVIADYGLVEVWLDGRKIASVRTDTKDNDYAYPGVGNYVDASDYPVTSHIYIDDVKVTQ